MLFQTDWIVFTKRLDQEVVSEDPMGYLSIDNLPLLPLSSKYTPKENFPVDGFTSSKGSALSFVCSWNVLWLSFYFAGLFLVSHHCWALALFLINVSAPQGISFFSFPEWTNAFPKWNLEIYSLSNKVIREDSPGGGNIYVKQNLKGMSQSFSSELC